MLYVFGSRGLGFVQHRRRSQILTSVGPSRGLLSCLRVEVLVLEELLLCLGSRYPRLYRLLEYNFGSLSTTLAPQARHRARGLADSRSESCWCCRGVPMLYVSALRGPNTVQH